MIPFFRKIRKKLADDNQFLKYSRYAVGEIVLVVIGILIALQINTWNEERKNDLKKEVYIQRLNNDLVKDTISLNNYIRECENQIRRWKNLKIQIEDSNTTLDSLIFLFINSEIGSIPKLSDKNDGTYKSLVSTGDIELFREDYMEAIMAYDSLDYIYTYLLQSQDKSTSDFLEIYKEFGFLTKAKKDNLIYKELKGELDETKFLKMFDVIVGTRDFSAGYNKMMAEALLNGTIMMIETLNQTPK